MANGKPDLSPLHERWQHALSEFLERAAATRLELDRNIADLAGGNADQTQLDALTHDTHQLAGSGGTFGFPEISRLAKTAERLLLAGPEAITESINAVQVLSLYLGEVVAGKHASQTTPDFSNAAPVEASAPARHAPRQRRVLIAEDDVVFAALIGDMFGDEIDVHTVHDGDEVVAAVRRLTPDVLLLDDGLPNLRGLDLIEALHRDGMTRDMGVVMLTANAAPDSVLRAIQAGAVDYLVKPVDPVALVRTIRERLDNSRTSVLLIDDDPLVLQLLRDGFRNSGCLVSEAADGETALEMVANEKFDLLVLDRMMPGLDGSAVLHRLKSNPQTRSIPVIILTARGGADESLAFLRRGVTDFITKPFNPDEVVLRGLRILERADAR
ncbi:response regulator [Maricaulis salignorans]|uniref:Hpt domain-containing protein n=1 Tax=Maricaulis salignorans TaxID=144026 RepID=A0A1G9LUP3_9PROT|nr:response regulator [Maricaulis salignorans]SDL65658.1 Hpt domain-containing protein [Maricaulis salignorans]